MVVATVKFYGKDGLGNTPYSYLVDEGTAPGLTEGQWVIVTNKRSKYATGVFCGLATEQDYTKLPYELQNVVMGVELYEEEI